MGLVRIGKVVRALGLKGYLGVAGSEGALGALERIEHWLKAGARPSHTVAMLIKRSQVGAKAEKKA